MIGSDITAAGAFGVLAVLIATDAPPALLVLTAGLGAISETPFVPASDRKSVV